MSNAVDVTTLKAEKFGTETIKAVTTKSGWDAQALIQRGDEHYRASYSVSEVRAKVIDGPAASLGTFVSVESKVKPLPSSSEGTNATFEYSGLVKFTKGKADITIIIEVESKSHYVVKRFTVAPA